MGEFFYKKNSPIFYMIKNLCIILICFLSFNNLKAQNLVPNYSFESNYKIPNRLALLDSAVMNWFSPWSLNQNIGSPFIKGGSTDYFHSESNSWYCSIPSNAYGYQYSIYGKAYVGFVLHESKNSSIIFSHSYKEYVEVLLHEQLVYDTKYCIDISYNIVNKIEQFYSVYDTIPYYPIKIGFLLTDTIVKRYLQQLSIVFGFFSQICAVC